MFDKETVLILGAGASVDAGYPLSDDLLKDIYKLHVNEVINEIKYTNHDALDIDNVAELSGFVGEDVNQTLLNNIFFRTKFARLLREFHPLNIDKFLRDFRNDESLVLDGKELIARILVDREDKNKLEYHYEKNDNGCWYRYLIDAITNGCGDDPSKISNNKLKIITFNYDISLEYYLQSRLSNVSFFNENEQNHSREYVDSLIQDNMIHVYGSVSDDYEAYGDYSSRSDVLQYSKRAAKRISIIDDNKQSNKELDFSVRKQTIRNWIRKAEKIVVLGYSFDELNNNVLFDLNEDEKGNDHHSEPNILHVKCFKPSNDDLKARHLYNHTPGLVEKIENLQTKYIPRRNNIVALQEFCYLNFDDSTIIKRYIDMSLNQCKSCNIPDGIDNSEYYKKPIILSSTPGKSISQTLATDFRLN